jgi:hypothetical protein
MLSLWLCLVLTPYATSAADLSQEKQNKGKSCSAAVGSFDGVQDLGNIAQSDDINP